ncbi:hypothetical protein [Mycobacterium celatum]|uniref:hypothetical protein n=1 Tax=Mycobacterium celatum TaxID=28045 RepID=UPI001EE74BFE|nr:hypothetical protein [Mycobacterium celatum]
MSPDLRASPADYAAAAAANTPPPPIPPTAVPGPGSIVDNLLATLGAAANIGVPSDFADALAGQAERGLKAADAEAKFPGNEEDSAARLNGLSDPNQMSQQIPQLASGIAGAIAGALGGALQPLAQAPQQAAQAGQQAMQMGMSGLQGNAADTEPMPEEVFDDLDELPSGGGSLGSGGFDATVPTAVLGPPPTPSTGTVPASSPTAPAAPGPPEPLASPRGGVGAVPMMPPTAMPGARGAPGDLKPDTKRVVVPAVRNGAPVQGRIAAPLPEVTKRVAGQPATSSREH